jgi:hypothetical protein
VPRKKPTRADQIETNPWFQRFPDKFSGKDKAVLVLAFLFLFVAFIGIPLYQMLTSKPLSTEYLQTPIIIQSPMTNLAPAAPTTQRFPEDKTSSHQFR